MKARLIEKIVISGYIFLGYACFWLENKVPKYLLIATVIGLGYLGGQSLYLFYEVKQYLVPSIKAIMQGSDETKIIILSWLFVLVVMYSGAMLKRVAFLAAVQLYNRFGKVLVP